MRFNASPLMVAVALGLLGPSVLEVEDDNFEERAQPDEPEEADASEVEAE